MQLGGYSVSGRWGYASGIDHCTWALGVCSVVENDVPKMSEDGAPETPVAFFLTKDCKIIDTWNVGGLRGTGSHDYLVSDLFVPKDFTASFPQAEPICAGTLYRIPYYSAQGIAIAPVLLGLAQAALDRYRQIAEARVPRVAANVARDDPGTQEIYGRATAALRASRAFIDQSVEELWSVVDAGSVANFDLRANVRLACVNAAETAKYVARLLHDDSGGAGLYEAQGLHRMFRDIHAASQHAQMQNTGFRNSGRVLLGLDPGRTRF